jgi:O-acetyl-ADP-ribose deacetylase (regulator of RNase III)
MSRNPAEKNIKLFISYRNIALSQGEGEFLATALREKYGYDVFIDTQKLKDEGGVKWAETIYENVRESDVLIVLLEQETSKSEWVQREIDVARGSLVSILPVAIIPRAEIDRVFQDVQDKLAIGDMQYILFTSTKPDFEPLRKSIERLSKQTRNNQRDWIDSLYERWRVKRAEQNNPSYAIYHLRQGSHVCKVHLATGDMAQMRGIDVLVNSENNYMQMARIYENEVLSSVLRREGSWMTAGRIKADSVQIELDEQIAKSPHYGKSKPIEMEQVIPTHAGHPQSQLAKNGARYIFHAATVYVRPTTRTVRPIDSDASVEKAVRNCLEKVIEVHQNRGVISPKGSTRRKQEEKEAEQYNANPIKSIVFPLFGTGRGGRSILEVAPPTIRAFRDFLLDHVNDTHLSLERIHLAIFSESDIPFVVEALQKDFVRED